MGITDWITAISSLVMTITTVFMAIIARDAKNSYRNQLALDDFIKLTELLEDCKSKLSHLSSEAMEGTKREELSNYLDEKLKCINKLLFRLVKFYKKKDLQNEINTIMTINKFHFCLIQEACPYAGVKLAYQEYLEEIIKIKKQQNESTFLEEGMLKVHRQIQQQTKKEQR